jgi:hypothetical protein
MDDVTPLMNAYRDCVRHLWNTYFQRDAESEQDWDLRDEFNAVAAQLFRALILWKVQREETEVQPDEQEPRAPLGFLHVVVEPRSEIMINRQTASGYWDYPMTVVEREDLDLRFLQYFDWDVLGFRDFAYYRVRIVGSTKYPQVVGKDALVPAGRHVNVYCEASAEQAA